MARHPKDDHNEEREARIAEMMARARRHQQQEPPQHTPAKKKGLKPKSRRTAAKRSGKKR